MSDNRVIAGYLAFNLLFGAAWNDATKSQRQVLHAVIKPLVDEARDRSTSPARGRQLTKMILTETLQVMGDDWQPQGEWAAQINLLLGRRA